MKKNWILTKEAFDALLLWLDEDREQAGIKYQKIRERLIRIFAGRNFLNAEDLADETLNRVAAKAPELSKTYVGEPYLYFSKVAKLIILEASRKPQQTPYEDYFAGKTVSENETNAELDCLNKCLDKLPAEKKEIILAYYQAEKAEKINNRTHLAEIKTIGMSGLRTYIGRIRFDLKKCIESCLEKK